MGTNGGAGDAGGGGGLPLSMRPHQLTPVLHLLYIGTLPFTLSCGAFKQSSAVPSQREGRESSLPFARSEGACSFPPPMLLLAVTEEGEGAPLASCCFVSFRFVFRVFASTGELERRSSSVSGGLQWLDARPMRGGGEARPAMPSKTKTREQRRAFEGPPRQGSFYCFIFIPTCRDSSSTAAAANK